ncbi:MAG: hypothetical protein ABI379_03585 [Rhodanobacter sp.]
MYKSSRIGVCLGVLGAVAVLSGTARAEQNGALLEVTIRILRSDPGIPAPWAQTLSRQTCSPDGPFDPHAIAQTDWGEMCRVTRYEQKGDVVLFDQVCAGSRPLTQHGEFHLTGGPEYAGTTLFSSVSQAGTTLVQTEYSARKTGSCTLGQEIEAK